MHYEHLLADWRDELAPALDRLASLDAAPGDCETAIDGFLDLGEQHHAGSTEALLATPEFSDLTKECYIAFKTATELDAVAWQDKLDAFSQCLDDEFAAVHP